MIYSQIEELVLTQLENEHLSVFQILSDDQKDDILVEEAELIAQDLDANLSAPSSHPSPSIPLPRSERDAVQPPNAANDANEAEKTACNPTTTWSSSSQPMKCHGGYSEFMNGTIRSLAVGGGTLRVSSLRIDAQDTLRQSAGKHPASTSPLKPMKSFADITEDVRPSSSSAMEEHSQHSLPQMLVSDNKVERFQPLSFSKLISPIIGVISAAFLRHA